MKSLKVFLSFWIFPLLIILAVIILQGKENLLDVFSNYKITVFTLVFFLIISFSSVFITNFFKIKGFLENKAIVLSGIICFAAISIFSIVLNLFFNREINLFPPFFQGLSAVAVFIIEYAILRFNRIKTDFTFEVKKRNSFYFKLIAIVMLIDLLFVLLLTLDTFINYSILLYYYHIKNLILYVVCTVIISFFGIMIINRFQINFIFKILILTFITFCLLQSLNIVQYKFHWGLLINFFMVSLFTTTLFYGLMYYYDQKEKLKKLNATLSKNKLEYNLLKDQINPHFLFNNLNTLISFIEDNPQKAVAFGHNLSNVYRHYLSNQSEDFVNLRTELAFIREYLAIYKAKFDNGFIYSIQNEFDKNAHILSASLQEVVDNIFKHNCLDEENPLLIEIYSENDFLVISNSILFKKAEFSNNTGLENIKKRYEFLVQRTIIIQTIKNKFVVKLPLIKTVNE